MRRNSGTLLLAALALLVASDATWLAAESFRKSHADVFELATSSLGLSCATSPEWCFFALDPRCESTCESELQPLPGLACPSPVHGAGVADLPPAR